MRFRALFLAAFVTLLGPLAVFSSPQDDPPEVRLMNAGEGVELVSTAWEQREQVKTKPDCSHLVHQVYELSGYPYPYASSYDLYDGIDNFQRVSSPRSGDLIVWRGHVGIVFDAAGHTFYSSVHSGLRTENYESPYWKAQGRPRFYRYIVRGSVVLSTANASAPLNDSPNGSSTGARAAVVPVRRPIPAMASPTPRPSIRAEAATVASGSASSLERQSVLPSRIMVVSVASRPTKEEVGEAISEFTSAAGNLTTRPGSSSRGASGRGISLRCFSPSDDPTGPPPRTTRDLSAVPCLIYDKLTVVALDLKSDRGTARVQVEGRLSISGERLDARQRREESRWEIRRTPQGWQVLPAQNRTYVPRDAAVRALASQLAALTQNEAPSGGTNPSLHQQAMIIRALGLLFDSN